MSHPLDALTSALRTRTSVAGRPVDRKTLAQRMDELHVPAVSVAVLHDGEVTARAWGAETSTLFQAASISKPVAAMGVVRLASDGALDLDAKVNSLLTSWQLPDGDDVTVRQLLCHAGALTVHGFPGYTRGVDTVPAATQILDGLPPANTDAVRVDGTPGEAFRYSGGGYTILQLVVADVTGEPFAGAMLRGVLQPAGMRSSTYEQPLPDDRHALAAHGHLADGSEIDGAWRTHPEQAAAGLWTAPTDLVAAAAEMLSPHAVLDASMRDEMLSPQVDSRRGLGWMLDGAWFQHGGSNIGFCCQLYASVGQRCAIAVMTNGDNGDKIAAEVISAAAETLGWSGFLKQRTAVEIDPATLDGVAGDYEIMPGFDLAIRRDPGRLVASVPGVLAGAELFAAAPYEFFPVEIDATLVWSGDVIEIALGGGMNFTARRKQP